MYLTILSQMHHQYGWQRAIKRERNVVDVLHVQPQNTWLLLELLSLKCNCCTIVVLLLSHVVSGHVPVTWVRTRDPADRGEGQKLSFEELWRCFRATLAQIWGFELRNYLSVMAQRRKAILKVILLGDSSWVGGCGARGRLCNLGFSASFVRVDLLVGV